MELMSTSFDKFYKYVYSVLDDVIPEEILGKITLAVSTWFSNYSFCIYLYKDASGVLNAPIRMSFTECCWPSWKIICNRKTDKNHFCGVISTSHKNSFQNMFYVKTTIFCSLKSQWIIVDCAVNKTRKRNFLFLLALLF